MNLRTPVLSFVILLMPITVRVPGDDIGSAGGATDAGTSSVSDSGQRVTIDVMGGRGGYALVPSSCASTGPPAEDAFYNDAAAVVEYSSGEVRAGVRAGWLKVDLDRTTQHTVLYFNPHVAWERPSYGAGLGYFAADDDLPFRERDFRSPPISGHLRIGPPGKHVSVHFLEGTPLISGGGYFRIGAGVTPSPTTTLWAGASAEPFDEGGIFVNGSWRFREDVSLLFGTRYGKAKEGIPETGVTLGFRWLPLAK